MGRTGIEFMFFISSPAAASHLLRRLVPSWTQPAADKRNVNPRNGENTSGAPVPKKDPLHLWLFFLFFSFFFPMLFLSSGVVHGRRATPFVIVAAGARVLTRRADLFSHRLRCQTGFKAFLVDFLRSGRVFFRNFWISRLILLGFTGFYLVPLCLTWLY